MTETPCNILLYEMGCSNNLFLIYKTFFFLIVTLFVELYKNILLSLYRNVKKKLRKNSANWARWDSKDLFLSSPRSFIYRHNFMFW